jgi:hypothetical protein
VAAFEVLAAKVIAAVTRFTTRPLRTRRAHNRARALEVPGIDVAATVALDVFVGAHDVTPAWNAAHCSGVSWASRMRARSMSGDTVGASCPSTTGAGRSSPRILM